VKNLPKRIVALALIPCLFIAELSQATQSWPTALRPAAEPALFQSEALVAPVINFIANPFKNAKSYVYQLAYERWPQSHMARQVSFFGWRGMAARRLSVVWDKVMDAMGRGHSNHPPLLQPAILVARNPIYRPSHRASHDHIYFSESTNPPNGNNGSTKTPAEKLLIVAQNLTKNWPSSPTNGKLEFIQKLIPNLAGFRQMIRETLRANPSLSESTEIRGASLALEAAMQLCAVPGNAAKHENFNRLGGHLEKVIERLSVAAGKKYIRTTTSLERVVPFLVEPDSEEFKAVDYANVLPEELAAAKKIYETLRRGNQPPELTPQIENGLRRLEVLGRPIRRIKGRWSVSGLVVQNPKFNVNWHAWRSRVRWRDLLDDESMPAVAERVEMICQANGISLSAAGISYKIIWLWKTGKTTTKNDRYDQALETFAAALGVEPILLRTGRTRSSLESALYARLPKMASWNQRYAAVRRWMGISIATLAAETGLAVGYIGILEENSTIPNPSTFAAIAQGLAIDPFILWTGRPEALVLAGEPDDAATFEAIRMAMGATKAKMAGILHVGEPTIERWAIEGCEIFTPTEVLSLARGGEWTPEMEKRIELLRSFRNGVPDHWQLILRTIRDTPELKKLADEKDLSWMHYHAIAPEAAKLTEDIARNTFGWLGEHRYLERQERTGPTGSILYGWTAKADRGAEGGLPRPNLALHSSEKLLSELQMTARLENIDAETLHWGAQTKLVAYDKSEIYRGETFYFFKASNQQKIQDTLAPSTKDLLSLHDMAVHAGVGEEKLREAADNGVIIPAKTWPRRSEKRHLKFFDPKEAGAIHGELIYLSSAEVAEWLRTQNHPDATWEQVRDAAQSGLVKIDMDSERAGRRYLKFKEKNLKVIEAALYPEMRNAPDRLSILAGKAVASYLNGMGPFFSEEKEAAVAEAYERHVAPLLESWALGALAVSVGVLAAVAIGHFFPLDGAQELMDLQLVVFMAALMSWGRLISVHFFARLHGLRQARVRPHAENVHAVSLQMTWVAALVWMLATLHYSLNPIGMLVMLSAVYILRHWLAHWRHNVTHESEDRLSLNPYKFRHAVASALMMVSLPLFRATAQPPQTPVSPGPPILMAQKAQEGATKGKLDELPAPALSRSKARSILEMANIPYSSMDTYSTWDSFTLFGDQAISPLTDILNDRREIPDIRVRAGAALVRLAQQGNSRAMQVLEKNLPTLEPVIRAAVVSLIWGYQNARIPDYSTPQAKVFFTRMIVRYKDEILRLLRYRRLIYRPPGQSGGVVDPDVIITWLLEVPEVSIWERGWIRADEWVWKYILSLYGLAALALSAVAYGAYRLFRWFRNRPIPPDVVFDIVDKHLSQPFNVYSWNSIYPNLNLLIESVRTLPPDLNIKTIFVLETTGLTTEQKFSLLSASTILEVLMGDVISSAAIELAVKRGLDRGFLLQSLPKVNFFLLRSFLIEQLKAEGVSSEASGDTREIFKTVNDLSLWGANLLVLLRKAAEDSSFHAAEIFVKGRRLVVQILDFPKHVNANIFERIATSRDFPLVLQDLKKLPDGGYEAAYGPREGWWTRLRRRFFHGIRRGRPSLPASFRTMLAAA